MLAVVVVLLLVCIKGQKGGISHRGQGGKGSHRVTGRGASLYFEVVYFLALVAAA